MSACRIVIAPKDGGKPIERDLASLNWFTREEDHDIVEIGSHVPHYALSGDYRFAVAGEPHARAWLFCPRNEGFDKAELGRTIDCRARLIK